MGRKSNWRLGLFVAGAVISSLLAAGAIGVLAFITTEISWALAAAMAGSAALPTVLMGIPYFNSKFRFSYDKRAGLKVEEETNKRCLVKVDKDGKESVFKPAAKGVKDDQ
jgi:hypothetical protein